MGFYKNVGTFKVWESGLSVEPGSIYKQRNGTIYEIVDVTDSGTLAHGRCGACVFNNACMHLHLVKYVPPCKDTYGRTDSRIVYFKKIDNAASK